MALDKRIRYHRGIKTHGRSGTPLYQIWRSMLNRCCNDKDPMFSHYGGRGIKVCDRWRFSFETFAVDVGERPSDFHSIDRIDNDGHYDPNNVRWATGSEQKRNTSRTIFLTHAGQTRPFIEWCEIVGVNKKTMTTRMRRGWSVERMLTTPPGRYTEFRTQAHL